jgi:hypothetical protein
VLAGRSLPVFWGHIMFQFSRQSRKKSNKIIGHTCLRKPIPFVHDSITDWVILVEFEVFTAVTEEYGLLGCGAVWVL